MKRLFLSLFILFIFFPCFSQTAKQRFLKGNLSDKATVLRDAANEDKYWLSSKSIDFVYENYQYLGDDRDFENFAVSAIYSIPDFEGLTLSKESYQEIGKKLRLIYFNYTSSNNVKCAILSKYVSLKNYYPTEELTAGINADLMKTDPALMDSTLFHSIVSALGVIGNKESFVLLFDAYAKNKVTQYNNELREALSNLIPQGIDLYLSLIHSKDIDYLRATFNLINNNSKISQNFISEIAENLLNESILLMSNSTENTKELVAIQLGAINILDVNNCTRAASSVVAYFDVAKRVHSNSLISDKDFVGVVYALGNLAPISSVSPLVEYLESANASVEKEEMVSYEVVTAIIKTLGAIGDKSAFDSLLAVTYLDYPDYVLSATREALAGLKW
ncbi:MAG: HEAT repeat domain-containing protein [Spirochaetia bacterium]|nr:HEAT repeat domain-containing protein [Spirochaetia bacterium]